MREVEYHCPFIVATLVRIAVLITIKTIMNIQEP